VRSQILSDSIKQNIRILIIATVVMQNSVLQLLEIDYHCRNIPIIAATVCNMLHSCRNIIIASAQLQRERKASAEWLPFC